MKEKLLFIVTIVFFSLFNLSAPPFNLEQLPKSSEDVITTTLMQGTFTEQNIKITFTGSGVSDKIDSVVAKNLNSGKEVVIPGSGILFLTKNSKDFVKKDTTFELNYKQDDVILFRCISGKYTTIITDSPMNSKNITAEFIPCFDFEGNNYAVVKIGSQIWMAENLRTDHYANGEPINTTAKFEDISKEISPKYQWVYNNDESLLETYGRLYTWDTVIDER